MMVPLESVRLKAPIDSHDQRNHIVLDARTGWECALDTELRTILARHKGDWTAEVPLENVAHFRRDLKPIAEEAAALAKRGGTPDYGMDLATGQEFYARRPKGKKR
jgi:hypothetical protein